MSGQGPVGRSEAGPVAPRPVARRRVVDLGIAVDRAAAAPLPDQVEHAVVDLVDRHELAPGAALPSTRALAAELGVSRGVVVEAYDRLIRQGMLVARPGAAVRVSASVHRSAAGVAEPAVETPATAAQPEFTLDLHPALTPLGTVDRRAWTAVLRTVLRDATELELAQLEPAGDRGLREALVAQLARSRGVVTTPEQLVVTGGVTDALHGLAPLLRARGGRIAVEDPGFGLHRATIIGAGLEVVPVRTDAEGIDVAALAREDVCAALVTPAHQMPLGVPLSPARRAALVAWARDRGTWLLEDDYDGELRYDRRGVRSLHGLAPDRVLYLGTTSKVLSPAIRVGWLVAPAELVGEVIGWRTSFGGSPSNLIQLALADALRKGAFDRGVSRMRRRCAAHRAALLHAVGATLPELEISGVEAGLHLAVRVPELDPWKLVAAAHDRGTRLFAGDDGPDALMLVGFGRVEPAAAPRVAAELAAIVAAARAR